MNWIECNNGAELGGRACKGTIAYVSEDERLAIIKLNPLLGSKTPWMLRELRDGDLYYLDSSIMENRGYSTLKEAKFDGEQYVMRKRSLDIMAKEAKKLDVAMQKANCDWIIAQAQELKALLSYNSDSVIRLNQTRALADIEAIKVSLAEVELYIKNKTK